MGTVIQTDWADVLRTEGINAQGYGLLPQFVMRDRDLSLTAKAIYAYLCSLSGNGETAYPSVETIKRHLDIGRRAYSTNFEQLIKNGYVTKQQQRRNGSQFAHNIYTLVSNPKKFELKIARDQKANKTPKLSAEGLKSRGFGFIPRMVTCDARLSVKAKGIYAYFAGFTGAGNMAFPSIKQITTELSINKDTYYKYIKELTSLNYITIIQTHDGQLGGNQYFLNDHPNEDQAKTGRTILCSNREEEQIPKNVPSASSAQFPKNSTTANNQKKTENQSLGEETPQFPKNVHPSIQPSENELPKEVYPINEPITKSIPTNTISHYNQGRLLSDGIDDAIPVLSEKDEMLQELKEVFMVESEDLDGSILHDPVNYEIKVSILSAYADFVLSNQDEITIRGMTVSKKEFIYKVEVLETRKLEELSFRLRGTLDKVRNQTAYILAALYTIACEDDNIYYQAAKFI